jgi:DNA replication protein DnaC
MTGEFSPDAPIERIRRHLVGLRMPRALETLDHLVAQIERGQLGTIEAIEMLLAEELTIRETRRIKAALQMARLSVVKTLSGFDFAFQPSLDRNRILALAQLDFIDRREVVHLIGQSGTGKSHLAVALGVEAVRAGRSVYFSPLADIIDSLARADREGRLRERIRYLCRAQLLIIDEIGYLSVGASAGNLFFQLVNARYEKGAIDPHLQPWLRRVGRGVRRSCRGHGTARQIAAPRRRRADRGLQLPAAPARRPAGTTAPSRPSRHDRAAATSSRQATQVCRRRNTRRLIPLQSVTSRRIRHATRSPAAG